MSVYSSYSDWLTALGGTFTRASNASYYNSSGTLSTASTNALRFDYDPVTLAPKGILLEGARTNLLLRSQEFDNASWNKVISTVTANDATAPDGTVTADRINYAGVGAGENINQTLTVAANTVYTLSRWIKNVGLTSTNMLLYDLSNSATIYNGAWEQSATVGQWVRQTKTFTTPVGCVSLLVQFERDVLSGATTYYLWGAQLEAGSFASSYIPTTSASATRAADVLTFPASPWFNASAGTFFAELDTFSPTAAAGRFVGANGGKAFLGESTLTTGFSWNGSSALYANNILSGSSVSKAIVAFDSTGRALTGAGLAPVTDANTFSGVTTVGIGSDGSASMYGHIRKVGYWPFRVTSAELQRLTT